MGQGISRVFRSKGIDLNRLTTSVKRSAVPVPPAPVHVDKSLIIKVEANPFAGPKHSFEVLEGNMKTSPDDSELSAVQASVASESGVLSSTLSVRRLRSSGPSDKANAEQIHAKNELTLMNLKTAEEGASVVVSSPLRGEGHLSLLQWDRMQENPAILDGSDALTASFPALAALQVLDFAAGGAAPPGTILSAPGSTAQSKSIPSSVSRGVINNKGGELAVSEKERLVSIVVSSGNTLEGLLLETGNIAAQKGVAAWGPPPPQTSAFDQLVLKSTDDEFLLDRGEVFELFARRRADPVYWTPARLSQHYGTKEEWVEILLETISPPLFAQVDGDQYGVFAILPVSDLGKH